MRTSQEEAYCTEVMTEVRGRERSCLDAGEAADRRSDAPMYMAMEMATVVTSITAGTAGEDTLEPLERNANGKRRRRYEVPATAWALGDWRSRMERAAQQQARELAQLHQTIAKMANMLEMHTALQEVLCRGMKTWLEEKEEMWDAYHQHDVLWGKDITEMVAKVVAATERDQREKMQLDTEGGGLEASIHAGLMQTGGPKKPEEHQELQSGRPVKSMPVPKPKVKANPDPIPTPNPAPAPGRTPTPPPRATSAQKGVMS